MDSVVILSEDIKNLPSIVQLVSSSYTADSINVRRSCELYHTELDGFKSFQGCFHFLVKNLKRITCIPQ